MPIKKHHIVEVAVLMVVVMLIEVIGQAIKETQFICSIGCNPISLQQTYNLISNFSHFFGRVYGNVQI